MTAQIFHPSLLELHIYLPSLWVVHVIKFIGFLSNVKVSAWSYLGLGHKLATVTHAWKAFVQYLAIHWLLEETFLGYLKEEKLIPPMLSDIEMSDTDIFSIDRFWYRSLNSSELIVASGNISFNVFSSKLLSAGWININSVLLNCNHKKSTDF